MFGINDFIGHRLQTKGKLRNSPKPQKQKQVNNSVCILGMRQRLNKSGVDQRHGSAVKALAAGDLSSILGPIW